MIRLTTWAGDVIAVAIDRQGYVTHDGEPVPWRNTWRKLTPEQLPAYCKRLGWVHPPDRPLPIPRAEPSRRVSLDDALPVAEQLALEQGGEFSTRDLGVRMQINPEHAKRLAHRLAGEGLIVRSSSSRPGSRTLWNIAPART